MAPVTVSPQPARATTPPQQAPEVSPGNAWYRPVGEFAGEKESNTLRQAMAGLEPPAHRTFTPTQAVLAKSAGIFHWTPEGRRLYDFTSGVLVSNLGHNPARWLKNFASYCQWRPEMLFSGDGAGAAADAGAEEFVTGTTMTAYNGLTPIEVTACERLLASLRGAKGGGRLESVAWAASGSEAVQKAIWACLKRDPARQMIIATRHGYHGKKGLSYAVTGSESDPERDDRVRFISFPMREIRDHSLVGEPIDLSIYQRELEALWAEHGSRLGCLITEPYLGGGGSYHPPREYHQLLQAFCRAHDILLIFDEVQANFGRTGSMYAFETYGVEPDFVVLGKGLGNGVPVAAIAGPQVIMHNLGYGELSDTWSANPLSCAAVVATLDEFESRDIIGHVRRVEPLMFAGLDRLRETGLIAHVRGEGMVYGIECAEFNGHSPAEVAAVIVRVCYQGLGSQPDGTPGDGIHLLGPLAKCVLRVSPPLVITEIQIRDSMELMHRLLVRVREQLSE
ncbi:MAG: aspartate aminotransferase family protein [Planctomyces sp.]|nr:aspartate aminotransferase family protein [Planctomyces sp.]